ncbi:MAG: ABC transporter permease [Kiritimatiellaeota bacterium]|nr:ABC transporter permease [Kiritimatiellota bacterium]
MKHYTLRRMLEILPTTFGVLVLTFLLFHVVGGSPAEIVLGKNATAEALAAFDARFGYDKPLLFGRWTEIRALGAVAWSDDDSFAYGEVSLTYPLPAGTYRINAGKSRIGFHRNDIVRIDEPRGEASNSTEAYFIPKPEFVVPEDHKLVALGIGSVGKPPPTLKLEKQNAGFFDSQFVNYCASLLRGDLGMSTEHQQPVAEVLREGVLPSLAITVPILVGGTVIGVLLGLLCAAWRGGAADKTVLMLSTVLMSVNYVVWVLAGQFILAFKLRLFPVWGFESAVYVALPVIIGIVSGLGRDVRFFRAAILDEIYKPYVRTARAKGLSGARVLFRHVLRNSLIPIVTYVSLSIPFLFTGSLLLERFFGIPGLGNASLSAIHASDMAVVRAVVILGALLYQVVNLLTDLCYAYLDPRVRLG